MCLRSKGKRGSEREREREGKRERDRERESCTRKRMCAGIHFETSWSCAAFLLCNSVKHQHKNKQGTTLTAPEPCDVFEVRICVNVCVWQLFRQRELLMEKEK